MFARDLHAVGKFFLPRGKMMAPRRPLKQVAPLTSPHQANLLRAGISAKRVEPGPPGVFGMDEIDIILAGYSEGVSALCTGFAKQSPGLKLEVTLHRMRDD